MPDVRRLAALVAALAAGCGDPASPFDMDTGAAPDASDTPAPDAPDGPDAPDAFDAVDVADNGFGCAPGQRFFNGACREACTTDATCAAGTRCVAVEPGRALCIDSLHCAYLGSDTQCVGVGTYVTYTRFGPQTRPYEPDPWFANPYDVTPYDDPDFQTAYPYADPRGCRGNARWVERPAGAAPACAARHDVIRCMRRGNRCQLVAGSTSEVPAP